MNYTAHRKKLLASKKELKEMCGTLCCLSNVNNVEGEFKNACATSMYSKGVLRDLDSSLFYGLHT